MREVLILGLGLLLSDVPALAHHAFSAEFDINKPVKLKGLVTKVEWTSPHVWFYIDVKDQTGKATNWALEIVSPNALTRAGWTRSSMKIGDAVTVEGNAARDGSNAAVARVVVLDASGQQLFFKATPQ